MNTADETIKPLPHAPDRALLLSGSDADRQKFANQWDAFNDGLVHLTDDLNGIAKRIEQHQKEAK